MEELFVNKTISDYDMYVAFFSRPQFDKLPKTSKVTNVFLVIFAVVWFLICVAALLYKGLEGFPNETLIPLILVCLYFAMRIFQSPSANAKIAYKQQKDIENKEFTMVFYEDRFNVFTENTDIVKRIANLEYYWDEDEKYFFLTRDRAFFTILSKSGFVKGTPEEFRNYLEIKPQFIREKKT